MKKKLYTTVLYRPLFVVHVPVYISLLLVHCIYDSQLFFFSKNYRKWFFPSCVAAANFRMNNPRAYVLRIICVVVFDFKGIVPRDEYFFEGPKIRSTFEWALMVFTISIVVLWRKSKMKFLLASMKLWWLTLRSCRLSRCQCHVTIPDV
jgi:hypothetical protein